MRDFIAWKHWPTLGWNADNDYLAAWHAGMHYKIGNAARKLSTSILSGEGFLTVFTGPGSIFVQTRRLRLTGTTGSYDRKGEERTIPSKISHYG